MSENPHLSDYLLDRLAPGDLDAEREARAREHLETCDECRSRKQDHEAAAAELLGQEAPEAFARRIAARRAERDRPRPARLWGAGLAAAAVLVLAFGLVLQDSEPTVRTKGGADLSFFVSEGGKGRPGLPGETLHMGDRIRLAVESADHAYVFVISVTGDGEVTPLYPEGSGASIQLSGEGQTLLDGSVILDDHRGDERLFALFSDRPLTAEEVTAAARKAITELRKQGEGVRGLVRLPLDATQATIWFRKE